MEKEDRYQRRYCGYCGKVLVMYETDFNDHQERCEKDAVEWYRAKGDITGENPYGENAK